MRVTTLCCVVVVLIASVAPAATASTQSEAYAGSNVTFETSANAVVDYAVGGRTMVEAIKVQSESRAESRGSIDLGADLASVTNVGGSAVSLGARTETTATVTTESGATLTAHDNGRGVLVVGSGGQTQYVTANVSSSGSAESEGDGRVVVTNGDGTQGTFLVVGDGEVTVNEEGNVAARLGSDGKLVFRSYPEGRSEEDAKQERLIADGTAAAEVYVMESAESSGELATDVVTYSEDTTVEVTETSEGTVRMTAERSSERGKVVVATVSERAISSAEDVEVTVDGEAAAKASSYSELQSAANGGDSSKYLVRGSSSAEASADVLVAVNHFSEREVEMSDGDSSGGSSGGASDSPGQPGFGVVLALLALLAVAGIARREA